MISKEGLPTTESQNYPIYAASALIFAGGLGTRARGVVKENGSCVKHLLPIDCSGTTLLDHSVATALRSGVGRVHLIDSHVTAGPIAKHIATSRYLYDRVSMFEHNIPAAGVAQVFELFLRYKPQSGPLIKLEGDELNLGLDLGSMYDFHQKGCHPITYMVTHGGDGYRYKLIANNKHLVTSVYTAPFSEAVKLNGYNLSGTFIINPTELDLFLRSGSTLRFLQLAIEAKKLYIYHHGGVSINVNSATDYQQILRLK